MKKILFLATILLATISCQEEEINTQIGTSISQPQNLQVVQITNQGEIIPINGTITRSAVEGELALQFISESDYQSTMTKISHMTTKERLTYVDNFTSLQKLADEADKELDEIGEAATSEADFRKKYAQYVEKYSGKLITNKYDAEDLTLYVPDGDNLSTYLINENKKVVIGNEVKEISLNNDMSNSEKAVFAAKSVSNEASGQNIHGKQKTTYSVTLRQNTMLNVHIGFQKKLWYGWRRDNHRDAYYHLDASPFQYNYWLRPEGKDAPLLQKDITCPDLYFFTNEGTVDYESGYIVGGSKVLTGTLYVWTDYTVEANKKRYNQVVKKYQMFMNEEMPICDKAKAYTLNFTVNYLW